MLHIVSLLTRLGAGPVMKIASTVSFLWLSPLLACSYYLNVFSRNLGIVCLVRRHSSFHTVNTQQQGQHGAFLQLVM